MNWLARRRQQTLRAPGCGYQYQSACVIWYANGWLDCGPRVRVPVRTGLRRMRGAKMGMRHKPVNVLMRCPF